MLTVTIDQSEGISGADIPEQAVKKMRTGSAAPSLPSPRAFFAFLFTERLFTTISEPGTGYLCTGFYNRLVCYTAVFSVVTQRSSPLTAAENRTTFLSRDYPIRIQLPFSGRCSRHVCGIEALLLSLPHV